MSRIRASETLLFFFFLVFRVLDAKKSSGAEADVAPSRRRRHGRHRIIRIIYREKVSSKKKQTKNLLLDI